MPAQSVTPLLWESLQQDCSIIEMAEGASPPLRNLQMKRNGNACCSCPCGQYEDTNPSFYFWRRTNRAKCFICNWSGDVIAFYMLLNSLTDRWQACLEMQREYLPSLNTVGTQGSEMRVAPAPVRPALPISLRPQILQLLEVTTSLYTQQLFSHAYAMQYLLKERGLTRRTIQEMRLGLAYRDTLARELDRLDISHSLAEEVGLLMLGGAGEFLHHRVVFPILDEANTPVFMIGRTLNTMVEPKYLNLPNTDLLTRQPMIFGAARRGCIVVEGAMDAAALRQWGLHHEYLVIALLGVGHHAIIEFLLSRAEGKPIYLSLDQDNAGKQASLQLAESLSAQGAEVRVLVDRDRYNTALILTQRLQTFSSTGSPNPIEQRIAAAQLHIEMAELLESSGWIQWVSWRGAKDAGALLPERSRGRVMFVAGLSS